MKARLVLNFDFTEGILHKEEPERFRNFATEIIRAEVKEALDTFGWNDHPGVKFNLTYEVLESPNEL